MSALLEYLQIKDRASYKQWCLRNHPDKRPDDTDATRKFQEVGAEWRRVYEASSAKHQSSPAKHQSRPQQQSESGRPQKKPRPDAGPTSMDYMNHTDKCMQTGIHGTKHGWCWRKRELGHQHCYYHMPGTDHMRFTNLPPHKLFSPFHMFHKEGGLFRAERSANSCEAKCANGMWCIRPKRSGIAFCHGHDPSNQCGHPTKSGKLCTRPKKKGEPRCALHCGIPSQSL
jgi:hypothetical protein